MIAKKIKLACKAIFKISNWWDYFFDYLGLKSGFVNYKINGKSIKVTANSNDKKIITELVLVDPYFPRWLELKKPTIIDLGAHVGIFSVLATSKFENSKVYAVEPSSKNFKLLCENIQTNNLNIIPFNIALSKKKGTLKLYNASNSARFSMVRKERGEFENVKVSTLKDFFKDQRIEKCDLLKIDIEGAEYDVLYSTPKYIFDKIDNIFMELHKITPDQKPEELIKFLENQGFKIKRESKSLLYATKK